MTSLMLDLEGTLYTRQGVIDGAREALAALREIAQGVRFLTNTDSQGHPTLLDYLASLGLDVAPDELFTPVDAAAARVGSVPGARALVVGTPAVIEQLARSIVLTRDAAEATHVIVGDCRASLSYPVIDDAFQALMAGAELVALQRGRFFLSGGRPHLDTGAIVAALEYAAQRTALVVGKPATEFLDAAVRSLPQRPDPADVWVVGDDASTDVEMGRAYGATTVQVRTGKFDPGQPPSGASHVIDSIATLPGLLRGGAKA